MKQKELLICLHKFVQSNETNDTTEILNKRAYKPTVPNLDKNTEDAVKTLYDNVKEYKIPGDLLSSLCTFAENLGPDDQSILNVLRAPNPANINVLIAAAQKLDDDYIEKHGSLVNLTKEGALTCVYVVRFLLVCIVSIIIFPLALFASCLSSTSCFSSSSAPMSHCQFLMDIFLSISKSVENTEDQYEKLTYDKNTAVANRLINFFKPRTAESQAASGANITLLSSQPFLAPQGS